MKIILATDHAGFELKQYIKEVLQTENHEVVDATPNFEESDDYPDKISAGIKVLIDTLHTDPNAKAIIFGGSGQGEAMTANKFKGIRATVFYGGSEGLVRDIIMLSKMHNDANVLSLGARFVSHEEAKKAVISWLEPKGENLDGRHVQRLRKLDQLGA